LLLSLNVPGIKIKMQFSMEKSNAT